MKCPAILDVRRRDVVLTCKLDLGHKGPHQPGVWKVATAAQKRALANARKLAGGVAS